MPEKDNAASSGGGDETGPGSGDICRDFLRNVCKRGKRCKFHHPEVNGASETSSSPSSSSSSDDRLVSKVGIPVCWDHSKGECQRGSKCKFRHEHESATCLSWDQVYSPSVRRYDPHSDLYESERYEEYAHILKRRRVESMRFEAYDYGMPRPYLADWRFLEEENLMLRNRIEELKKQASNLMATNEILLEQNAQFRNQTKVVTLTSGPADPPTVGTVTNYNHSIVQTHTALGAQGLQPRAISQQELVASASPAVPPANPDMSSLPAALAQTLAQGLAPTVSMAPVTVSVTPVAVTISQPIAGITMSHTTTPMVSYAIASQGMRITPIPH
ncbi:zinc finger CCCH domain-containing protein 10-like [Callorhinchus milii]|uniref:Zinc finger CCCH-type containing 10 n=1 Tax=Callorhinchus milii TaxID=7868 RepID=A0A4W3IBH1_CALMI|nr:zinc finger CCCH domain-containing protein 10-like [Callorhinchus milii]|eukprot:gi/632939099/ref/XP_007907646.1/ PREDICTED: zinc finger CCCH domain-containing protein 10-like [Callorhinchus milii]